MNFLNQLLENLRKKKFIHLLETIFGVFDFADMQSLNKYDKGIKYLLCAIDLFSKYAWIVSIKDKKGTSIANTFKKIISEGRKPNKVWVDRDS